MQRQPPFPKMMYGLTEAEMIKSYLVTYRVNHNGRILSILLFGKDFLGMAKQNEDILSQEIEVIKVELQEK